MRENQQFNDFLPLAYFAIAIIGVILAVVGLFLIKKNAKAKKATIALSIITFSFFIGTIITGIIAILNPIVVVVNVGRTIVYPQACSWVCLGLSIFTLLFGIVSIVKVKKMSEKGEKIMTSKGFVQEDQVIVPGQKTVLFTVSSNNGVGLWTSICMFFAAIFGVESKNLNKKLQIVSFKVRMQLTDLMEKHPEYEYSDFRIIKEGNVAYTGYVLGRLKESK